jgi:hypothetical protein
MTMLTDFMTPMSRGYFDNGMENTCSYFDLYFRSVPQGGGYAIMAGVEQMVDYLQSLHFTEDDLCFWQAPGSLTHLSRLSPALPVRVRRMGNSGRNTDLSRRADRQSAWANHPGADD